MGVDSPLDIIKVEDSLWKHSGESRKVFNKKRGVKMMLKLFSIFVLCKIKLSFGYRHYLEIHFFRFDWGCHIYGERIFPYFRFEGIKI